MRTKSILPVLALIPMIGAAGAALAQPAPAEARQGARPMTARFCEDAPARGAARLAYLQEKLKLRADQQQAWNTFATQARASAEPMMKLCADMPAPPPRGDDREARRQRPAPDASAMLGQREKMLTAQLESTKGLKAAVDAFSPTLSAEQKETLGRTLMRSMGGKHGPRHAMMHHQRDHGPRDHGHRDHGPRDGGPRDGGPRDSGPERR